MFAQNKWLITYFLIIVKYMHSYLLYASNNSNEQQSLFKNPHSFSCRRHFLRFLQADVSLPHSRESATALTSERDEPSPCRPIFFNIHFEYYLPNSFKKFHSSGSQTKILDMFFHLHACYTPRQSRPLSFDQSPQ